MILQGSPLASSPASQRTRQRRQCQIVCMPSIRHQQLSLCSLYIALVLRGRCGIHTSCGRCILVNEILSSKHVNRGGGGVISISKATGTHAHCRMQSAHAASRTQPSLHTAKQTVPMVRMRGNCTDQLCAARPRQCWVPPPPRGMPNGRLVGARHTHTLNLTSIDARHSNVSGPAQMR